MGSTHDKKRVFVVLRYDHKRVLYSNQLGILRARVSLDYGYPQTLSLR